MGLVRERAPYNPAPAFVTRRRSGPGCGEPVCGAAYRLLQHSNAAGAAYTPAEEAESLPDVATKVVLIISGHLGIDPGAAVPEAALVDDLGADSLDTVELVIAFEEAFGINIPDADVARIETVRDAIEYVQARTTSG
jgi:acyl carrier protein